MSLLRHYCRRLSAAFHASFFIVAISRLLSLRASPYTLPLLFAAAIRRWLIAADITILRLFRQAFSYVTRRLSCYFMMPMRERAYERA